MKILPTRIAARFKRGKECGRIAMASNGPTEAVVPGKHSSNLNSLVKRGTAANKYTEISPALDCYCSAAWSTWRGARTATSGHTHRLVDGYGATTLLRQSVLNFAPNGSGSALWMAGAGLAADHSGNVLMVVG